jgi:hypothetical protein
MPTKPTISALVRRRATWDDGAMKGDRVEIIIDVGDGTKTFEITATKAGRRVEVSNIRGTIEVNEVTRNGEIVRTGRFMAQRVVAVIEHPALDEREPGSTRSKNQASML